MDANVKPSRSAVRRWIWRVGIAATIIAVAAMLLAPKSQPVDVVEVRRGPMRVEIEGEGRTRLRDRYTVTAPITGDLERVELRVGDSVEQGAIVARMRAAARDPAQIEELTRRVESAEHAWRTAVDVERQARIGLDAAQREHRRLAGIESTGAIARQEVDLAQDRVAIARTELAAAEHRSAALAADVKAIRANIVPEGPNGGRLVDLRAPASGRIMSVVEQSRRTIPAGSPIVVLGDPAQSEVVVDLLSSDAVRVAPGARVRIDGWGGDRELAARVRHIEPVGVTRLSALGIEEQRVDVVADLIDHDARLGDGYRVEVRIVVWEHDDVLMVPTSALFRYKGEWALFAARDSRAVRVTVRLGQRNPFATEILSGVRAGEKVIPFPSDKIDDGTRVTVASVDGG